jgi:hypothetical protein
MQKLTQAALVQKIIRGELEMEYEANRFGLATVRDCRTGKCRNIRVIN